MKLEGKVALVTGGAHGQGANHCAWLAREGASIAALDICRDVPECYPFATEEELTRSVAACHEIGVEAMGVIADVRSRAEVKRAVEEVLAKFGRIDILVNNAGVAAIDGIDEMSEQVYDAIIDINLKGTFNLVHAVAPGMKERSYGKIVNVSSAQGLRPKGYLSHYCAAKGGVIAATVSWAWELGEWGINVNAIAPGTIFSGMTTGLADQLGRDIDDWFVQANAGGMFTGDRAIIEKDDTSAAVLFLVSDEAKQVSGHVIPVAGGKTA